MMLLPFVEEPANTMMLRFWRSRTILTAVSLSGAAPRMAANPGIRPSTS